jgi:hypothetical protein
MIIEGTEIPSDEEVLQKFRTLDIGASITLPIHLLSSSQIDDGVETERENPIEVCISDGKLIIVHGHHRYFTQLKSGKKMIQAKKIRDPWSQW